MALESIGRQNPYQENAAMAKIEPVKAETAQGQKSTQEPLGQTAKYAENKLNFQDTEGTDEEKKIKTAVQNANSQIKQQHLTRCEFSYHEDTKRVSIKVIDRNTQAVIREIPPEQTLEMVEKMWELAGLLVDERR